MNVKETIKIFKNIIQELKQYDNTLECQIYTRKDLSDHLNIFTIHDSDLKKSSVMRSCVNPEKIVVVLMEH